MDGIIINFAPTGALPAKLLPTHVPITVNDIVQDVRRCIAAGVNMVHLHARDEYGNSTHKKEIYARLIGSIREFSEDVVICVSLSGRNINEFDKRSDPLTLTGDLKPDMGSLTLSSMNFNKDISVNSPEMIKQLAQRMSDFGIKPELEIFDSGMMNYAKYLLRKGTLSQPLYCNIILGNIASAQATPSHVGLLINDLPEGAFWVGGGLSSHQMAMNTLGILYGSGVRVGLEDNWWIDDERNHHARNIDLVERIISLAGLMGKRPAPASEIREVLGL